MERARLGRFLTFLMVVLILFWGSSFVVVKVALSQGLTPIGLATYRFLFAGAFFLMILLFRKAVVKDSTFVIGRKDLPTVLLLALLGVTFFFMAQYTGIRMASASVAAILVCLLSPVLISVASARIYREHLTGRQIVGICVSAAGSFTVVVGGSLEFGESSSFLVGSLILLCTPFFWAAYSLVGKKIMRKYDPLLIVSYVNGLGGLCLIPFSLAEGSLSQVATLSFAGWSAVLFLSLTCSVLGYYIWFYVLMRVEAAVASSFLFAEPLVTVAFAVAFVGETLNMLLVTGAFLILIGVYLVSISRASGYRGQRSQ